MIAKLLDRRRSLQFDGGGVIAMGAVMLVLLAVCALLAAIGVL